MWLHREIVRVTLAQLDQHELVLSIEEQVAKLGVRQHVCLVVLVR